MKIEMKKFNGIPLNFKVLGDFKVIVSVSPDLTLLVSF